MEPNVIKAEIEALADIQAGMLLVISVLIRTHPDPHRFHLALTTVLEQQLGTNGGLASRLSPNGATRVRELVEWLGAIAPPAPAAPR